MAKANLDQRRQSGSANSIATQPTYSADTGKASLNNLKQIALAFHNYHDVHKTFPAAVQVGPKNVQHSWRITILPYLGETELYNRYRQDEP